MWASSTIFPTDRGGLFKRSVLCGILANTVSAFTTHPQTTRIRLHQGSHNITPLSVAIYYPDDNGDLAIEEDESDSSDIVGFSSSVDDASSIFDNVAVQLSTDPTITGLMARLASTFSPSGFDINLENINQVRLRSLDSNHVEIETVVCDEAECSALLVPVMFQEECAVGDDDYSFLAECVLSNMHYLDATGEENVEKELPIFQEEEEAQLAFEVLQSLDSDQLKTSPLTSLPSWWVPPNSTGEQSECELLEELLNGNDMQDVLCELACYMLPSEKQVGFVRAKPIGPMGIILKVNLAGSRYGNVVDVPIKFSDMLGEGMYDDGRSIREKVLMMVSSLSTTG